MVEEQARTTSKTLGVAKRRQKVSICAVATISTVAVLFRAVCELPPTVCYNLALGPVAQLVEQLIEKAYFRANI